MHQHTAVGPIQQSAVACFDRIGMVNRHVAVHLLSQDGHAHAHMSHVCSYCHGSWHSCTAFNSIAALSGLLCACMHINMGYILWICKRTEHAVSQVCCCKRHIGLYVVLVLTAGINQCFSCLEPGGGTHGDVQHSGFCQRMLVAWAAVKLLCHCRPLGGHKAVAWLCGMVLWFVEEATSCGRGIHIARVVIGCVWLACTRSTAVASHAHLLTRCWKESLCQPASSTGDRMDKGCRLGSRKASRCCAGGQCDMLLADRCAACCPAACAAAYRQMEQFRCDYVTAHASGQHATEHWLFRSWLCRTIAAPQLAVQSGLKGL